MSIIKIKNTAINLNRVRYCKTDSKYVEGNQVWFVHVQFDNDNCRITCRDEAQAEQILDFIAASSK
jgi:hypothetical protein